MSGAEDAQEAAELVDEFGGLGGFVERFGIGGILFALFVNIIDAINATGELLLAPFRALASGLAELVTGTIGEDGALALIEAGASTAVSSIETGLTTLLGPFAFPFAVGVVMIALWAFVAGISRIEFSPLVFIRSRVG